MELFRLLGTIAINNKDANNALEETAGNAGKFKTQLVSTLGSAAKVVAKAAVAATTAAATAVTAITKSAVESYAEYEQLVGGVDTLFKESSQKVQQYAAEAYQTAGLTANNYMSTVTSFSASLLQGLSGDTEAAAELANTAIIDMADNANKMGSDMESIQAAYQGFAKQNYTLLDNLKLGYGGTATEMARLLNESGVLGDAMIDLTDKQGIGAAVAAAGFNKIIEAIHVVQTEMGITGTTSLEASSTIQGSAATMKAAWQNLLTGMADENQNLDILLAQFLDSVETFGNNLIPRIEKLLPRLVSAVSNLATNLAGRLPSIIETLLPVVIQGAVNLVAALVKELPALTKSIITAIFNGLKAGFPVVKDAGKALLQNLWDGLKAVWASVSSWISEKLSWITDKFKAVKNFVSDIGDAVTGAAAASADARAAKATSKVSAHAAGGILTKPTIFGYTPSTGTYHLGGEAGAEAIAPISVLQGYVRAAVAEGSNTEETNGLLKQLIELQKKSLQTMANTKIELDGREFGRMVKGYA